ncbi:MAG: hypothetical protein ACI4TD_00175 [Phocaeicola sp.]
MYPYRIHDLPGPDKLENLSKFILVDPISIIVAKANLETKQLDFTFA